ncbi:LysR family transcriptional regulator [Terasakiella sp. A23]|uniref:LysR family transcriptional regulator n=1 Tax=Terasakiella sp. FCG-A23 TaxID=3080561 RepID=UPI002953737F|nr:LysR family transcriptional regulator [Terasakiella sp. A23]MDV7341049.1 LysR family transcriptional regulator [Terasakiella sp. A23]
MNIDHLILFQKIVEKGGLAVAGRELGLSPTTVSERLAALESYYGVTLLNRTTRAISLTEEGRVLFEGAHQLLSEVDELDYRIRLGAQTLSGPIRISAPLGLGRDIIEPVINQFLEDNPQTSVELMLSDGYVDIIHEGIDFAVRFGELRDSSLRARVLGENHRVVVASPDYIKRFGRPEHPNDLEKHNCMVMRFGLHPDNVWRFVEGGKEFSVNVTGNRIANDGRLVHQWALEGHGLALKSMWDVGRDVKTGKLVHLLADFAPEPSLVQLLFPPSRSQPRRVKELAAKLTEAFERRYLEIKPA